MADHTGPSGSNELREHWRWRPEWTPERPCLWWYLTFERHGPLRSLHRHLGRSLRRSPAVDVVPARWLHLTVQEVGYADEVSDGQLDVILSRASRAVADLPALELTLGPPMDLPGAVALKAGPAHPVDEVRSRLREATGTVRAGATPDLHPVDPHVSLAYVNRDTLAADLMEPLFEMPFEPLHARVTHATLTAVTRRDRHYQWTSRGVARFGTA